MATIYLGLGSNLGDRRANIDKSLSLLVKNGINILKHSTIIETKPVGGPEQNKFLNSVIKAETELSPFELLEVINNIEKNLGRVRTIVNGPRTIDIDILLYNKIKVNASNLSIPHPQMLKRDFVLTPLKEIEPKLVKELLHAHN
ncbi:MAG: 2-amino-4-hydroxy-6-hydroxymethyldihydropteridine diphosphokinase [Omnitrophica WOR_2 bacterium GWF2_38_59]|nr:MAG: 2-amino-4-hydroxy-6-hydroxymethyldihydropteridine diphosphokinase [Omnitrophica WOR_2 bacterium GWA2_37_7]OGX26482.1 MAG: 2-amino-4-hydroxy-6-hydroxymethyldihydropteridine diphosphokinase [Omnitrophica WOR_2 bacterium GWF2_38_59]OGX49296.1 MAG: 2-amino-4-hydroxy-6-hydroxymethyldihydropteridine diphosphokinase [Omnitrophica WOR_2 bacterium RIFOXYA2_FULL_38_17]OGX55879.1 MAG: 2-amino-4-hydroxy-6-hydroxymethyldihydropteridine diphosphokinase [Omnitrophica WOR_2 bacterium RIFOXYC2_FULL_38_12